MAKKATNAEKIAVLIEALQALLTVSEPEAVKAAYAHGKDVLRALGALPAEPVTPPLTANRVMAIFAEMHKAHFGFNPRFDGHDANSAKNIGAMFFGTEELHFRMIVREYLDDGKDTWMNGGPNNPPMMHALKWLDSSQRIMRYEYAIAQREFQEAEPEPRDKYEGIPT